MVDEMKSVVGFLVFGVALFYAATYASLLG